MPGASPVSTRRWRRSAPSQRLRSKALHRQLPPLPQPSVPLSKEERFGLRGDLKEEKAKKAPELAELKELRATVTKVAAKPYGELILTLDNGQVWYEIQANSGIRVKTGDQVTIRSGALGSYSVVAPNGRSSKVTRVR